MRRSHSVILFSLAIPLLVLQTQPVGCFPSGTDGGTTTPLFNLPPTVVMTADIQRGVAPLTVLFSSSGSSDNGFIVTRAWDFGDGGTSAEISPTHTFTTTGVFTVRLTLTDDRGDSASKSLVISVTQRPVARFTVTFNGVANVTNADNAPATFSFDATASYDPDAKEGEKLLYRWDFGDGSRELLSTINHTFATAGTYRVRLTVTDAVGVTGTADKIIQVGIPQPTITFRSPPDDVKNLVLSLASPLWTHVVYTIEPGVPRRVRAGLDGDRDMCGAMTVLYNGSTGLELRRLADGEERLRAAAFSPDSRLLLTGGDDGTVRRYDLTTGSGSSTGYTWNGSAVQSVAWHPAGSSIAAGYRDGSVVVRDIDANGTATATREFPRQPAAVNAIAFSPDGTQLFTGDNSGRAVLWRVSDATSLFTLDHGGAAVTSVAFGPADQSRVLTGSSDQYARLWSTANGQLAQEYGPVSSSGVQIAGHTEAVLAVAVSPDGATVLTGSSDNTAKVWNAGTGSEIRTLSGHTGAVNTVGYSPDGAQVITGSDDGSAILWRRESGEKMRTHKPCSSPIAVAAFSPDAQTVLTAVGAYNDIQLDASPPQGNDLNLTLPTALQLPSNLQTSAEGRTYYLWAEIDTEQLDPVRTYATASIRVVPTFVASLDDTNLPTVPLEETVTNSIQYDLATVVLPPTTSRQIFSLGELSVGDRLFISFLNLPGYGNVYDQRGLNPLAITSIVGFGTGVGSSLLILDAQEKMYAWYESDRVLFSPDSRLVIGHDSPNYFVVLDGMGGELAPSVNVRIQRGFSDSSEPRTQYVHLNFDGADNIAFARSAPIDLDAFTIPGRSEVSVATVRTAIAARVQDLLAPYGFTVSEDPPPSVADPRLTIYFDIAGALLEADITDRDLNGTLDADDLYFWGMPDYIDPRGETLTGRALVVVGALLDDPTYAAQADGELGLTIGNVVLHQIGLMCGLRETIQDFPDDIMTVTRSAVGNAGLTFADDAPLAPAPGLGQIGIQDAPELLAELFGTR